MNREPAYDEPYCWWGPGWRSPTPRTLADLVRGGMLTLPLASLLAAAVERRWSLTVVAGPSGTGKTTLLSALLPWLGSDTRRFYLRGSFEPFAFLADRGVTPQTSTILCNEISPHLPAYLWGEGVGRVLLAREQGFQVLATAHAADALDFVRLLAGPPLRIRPDRVAGFDLVVALALDDDDGARGRSVSGMWRLHPTPRGGVEVVAVEAAADPVELARAIGPGVPPGVTPLDAGAVEAAMADILRGGRVQAADPESLGGRQTSEPRPWRPRRSRPNG